MIATCPNCGMSGKVPDRFVGKKATCPKCRNKFLVAQPASVSPPAEEDFDYINPEPEPQPVATPPPPKTPVFWAPAEEDFDYINPEPEPQPVATPPPPKTLVFDEEPSPVNRSYVTQPLPWYYVVASILAYAAMIVVTLYVVFSSFFVLVGLIQLGTRMREAVFPVLTLGLMNLSIWAGVMFSSCMALVIIDIGKQMRSRSSR
ncbi:MAG: hypothetical protein KatS3mg105_1391 [Gemmatales bacterium]|nr:MAG: hypothetical protein KatS3mg105_1391 [Gemmatales bacterium]